MKNRIFLFVSILTATFCPEIFAQHEGCKHGAAPSLNAEASGNIVQAPKDAAVSIGLKTVVVGDGGFDETIPSFGRIEYIPQRVHSVATRIAGRAVEVFAAPDSPIKKGEKICRIESLLAGNPPPSIVMESPADGILENLPIVRGSPVERNSEIARIADVSKLYAVANVYESNVDKLKIGQGARIAIEALGGKIFEGKLVKFGSKVSPSTDTLPVYFVIDNPDGKIKSGMRATFSILLSQKSDSIAVPNSAIAGDIGNRFVFVETCPDDMTFEKRRVVVGKSNDIDTQILSGLKKGEKIAVAGVYQLQFMPPAKPETDSHNHAEEIGHRHDKEPAHEHEEAADEHDHSKDVVVAENGYIENFVYSALAVSLLLNLVFAFASLRGRKSKGGAR